MMTFDEVGGRPAPLSDPAIVASLKALPEPAQPLNLSVFFRALIRKPVLLILGEHSDLLDEETVEMAAALGAETHTVPGEGHAPRLRGPVLSHIEAFLKANGL